MNNKLIQDGVGMTLQQKQRILWIDIAKCLAIMLVVLGHTLRGGQVQKFVYSFHVPAFFFLSGMTCKTDKIIDRIKLDFIHIMIPYYCFGIMSILVFIFLGEFAAGQLGLSVDTSFGRNLMELLFTSPHDGRMKFNVSLWFLPCLFAVKIMYCALYKLCRGKQLVVILFSIALAGCGFLYTHLRCPGLPFNLPVAMKMLFVFSLGRYSYLWYQDNIDRFSGSYRSILLGVILLVLTALTAALTPQINYTCDYFPSVPAFLIASTTGSIGICLIAMGLRSEIMARVGRSTLAILVMHKFPILLFQTIGPQKVILSQVDSVLGVAVAVLISLISIGVCLIAEWIIHRICPFCLGDFSFIISLRKRMHISEEKL